MKHTPGPWIAMRGLVGTEKSAILVADCNTQDFNPTSETIKANASLIAAAPDLLFALQEALAREERHYESEETKPGWVILAREAIRKAEGEE